MAEPRSVPGGRRALSNLGGEVELAGEREAAQLLRAAWQAAVGEAARLTHGFHTYPARMHPGIARALIATLSAHGARVLDPFCGSGTVLIEALAAGRRALGVDLNPLAIRIAEVQCELRGRDGRARFEHVLERTVGASLARVRARRKVRAPLSARERAFYDPHVLLELAGLHAEIEAVDNARDRRALEVVFSALLVKFSRQRADTTRELASKRIRKGLASEFFLRKGRELSQRWAALAQAAGDAAVPPRLVCGDARELPALLGNTQTAASAFELVLSSPPYGGTYDYHAHHARRYAWLGIDAEAFFRDELGARRRLSRASGAAARWDAELAASLRAIAGVCRPGARVVLLLGDAAVGGVRVDAREQLTRLAPACKLEWIASAAQRRRDHAGGPPRREHLVLLQRS